MSVRKIQPGSSSRQFWRRGEPMVWATAAALAIMLLMTATLLVVVAVNGLGVFWPAPLAEITLADGTKLLGRQITSRTNPDDKVRSIQFKTANREFDPARQDFRWVPDGRISQVEYPAEVMVLERLENGDFYGFSEGVEDARFRSAKRGGGREAFCRGIGGRGATARRSDRSHRRRIVHPERSIAANPPVHDEAGISKGPCERGRRRPSPSLDARLEQLRRRRRDRPPIATDRRPAAAARGVAAPQRGVVCRRPRADANHRPGRRRSLLSAQHHEPAGQAGPLCGQDMGTAHRPAARIEHRGRPVPGHLRHRDVDLPHGHELLPPGCAGRRLPGRICHATA